MGVSTPPAELAAFLRGESESGSFHHRDHVRMGFELLRLMDFPAAAQAYSRALKCMAARAGRPQAYHETITLAFLSLISERTAHSDGGPFDAFAHQNGDLLDKAILGRWYAPERLGCDLARRTFLLPDQIK